MIYRIKKKKKKTKKKKINFNGNIRGHKKGIRKQILIKFVRKK